MGIYRRFPAHSPKIFSGAITYCFVPVFWCLSGSRMWTRSQGRTRLLHPWQVRESTTRSSGYTRVIFTTDPFSFPISVRTYTFAYSTAPDPSKPLSFSKVWSPGRDFLLQVSGNSGILFFIESAALRAGTVAVRGFRTVSELDRSSTQVDRLCVFCKPGSERRVEIQGVESRK